MSESMTNAEYFNEIYTMCIVSKEDVLMERADLTPASCSLTSK